MTFTKKVLRVKRADMRKLVVAICLDLFTECRCSNAWWVQEGRSQQEEKTVVKNSSGVLIKFYRGQKGYLLKDHGLAWGIETRYLPRTNAAPVHLRGDTVKPFKIPILERLYAVFDEVGRNNLTTLPTTNLGQNGAIIMQKPGS